MDKREIEIPKEDSADKLTGLIKAGIDAVPAGSIMTWFIEQIWKPPLVRRTEKWMNDVTEKLKSIDVKIEDLVNNERFITCLTQSYQVATRTHNQEKVKALKNAVINSIPTPTYSESLQSLFINYIDSLTEWHIRFLTFFNRPDWMDLYRGKTFEHAKYFIFGMMWDLYPDLKDKEDLTELIFRDLKNSGLINQRWETVQNLAISTQGGTSIPKVTDIGKDFLEFIND